ncbi:MAG TPA: oligopeptide/dipeptide ABC transporter ATP-binding protein, partial [Coriobacteriia bacterium]|nr:oligopeptide/dipeptide ABC transporter ATP-binding protein [Coriobacteriia bacterium]
QAQILELMIELQQRTKAAIIMITHDLGVVADIANDVMVMYAGKQVEYGSADVVFYEPSHPYTWGLLDSLPRHDVDEKGTLMPIEGQPPSLIDVPSGCAFHPRCLYAKDICVTDCPLLRDVGDGHLAACHFAGEPGFTRGTAPRSGEVA